MVAAALAARVVEVITDLGGTAGSGYRYGSGCIVNGRTVLTAAHVVADALSVVVRTPDKREYTAAVDPRFVGDLDGPGPDVALLEIDDPAFDGDLPPMGLAAVDRNSSTAEPAERCHAVGYPWFAETPSPRAVRDTVDAIGVVPVLSRLAAGLLSVQVTVAPRELPPQETALAASEWSGMSGAPVVTAGCLLGVVTEHAPREGPSTITAVPLTALQADPVHEEWGPGVADPAAWWSRLGVEGVEELRPLPVPPPPRPEPAYRATVREFGRTLHRRMPQLLGRDRELAEIGVFATGDEGYRWLAGGAFTGKSALLYEAVTVGLPDEVDAVCYFLSRRASDASSDRFLAAVVPQLAYLRDVDTPVADRDHYHALWQQAVGQAEQTGRHLLLVVDGLDEDLLPPGSPSVASLLPTLVGAHAHVLVASRPHPELPDDVLGYHPLTAVTPTELSGFKGAQKLAELAKKEIGDLAKEDDADLAIDVLGQLAAAAGGLSIRDLIELRSDGGSTPTAADTRHVRRLVEDRAARSLERIGLRGGERYQFAHASLLEYAQTDPDLSDPEYQQRIHRWAGRWRDADWPTGADGKEGTPQYLLDTYPSILADDPRRLARLVCDVGWSDAAITFVGVDSVMADLREATAANATSAAPAAVLAAVIGQAHNLRPPHPVDQSGYILRQLWMQAAELTENDLAEDIRTRLQSRPSTCLVPRWTTRRVSRALAGELGRHDGWVGAVAVLPDGRVVTGGDDERVLVWDPDQPEKGPAKVGRHHYQVSAVAVLPDGRVVTGGYDDRVLVWDLGQPGTRPAEVGRHDGRVSAVAVLPDGRVVTGGYDDRVLVWDLGQPGKRPAEVGRHDRMVSAVAVLPDGRVVTGGYDDRVLVWDPGQPGTRPAEVGRHDGPVLAVAVLSDGRVVTGGYDDRVLVWDLGQPGTRPAEVGRHDGPVMAVAALGDGRVVTGGFDDRVLVWDLGQPGTRPAEVGRHDGRVSAVAVLGDGRVVTGGYDDRVLVWDPGQPGTGPAKVARHDSWVRSVAVLGDGRVVTGGYDKRVLVWDPDQPGTGPVELGRGGGPGMAVLGDGRVVTGGYDGQVEVWDPGQPEAGPVELGRGLGPVHEMAVLPGGRVVVRDADERVLVCDPDQPETGPVELGRGIGPVRAVLGDGRVVTGGYRWRVLVWDPDQPRTDPVELDYHDSWVSSAAVLPDGRVVTGWDHGWVLVWDPDQPRTHPVKLGRHKDAVRSVAVLPGGRVVTGGSDGRVLVWDPDQPRTGPVKLGRHRGAVRSVAVLPGGRVVTGGSDSRVLVWDPAVAGILIAQLSCSAMALWTTPLTPTRSDLVIAHEGSGFSFWSFTK